MDKTIVVQIERKVKHPLYGKYIRKFSKMYAHDADNICKIGDTVEIEMCRPISRTKSWKLLQVLNQADKEAV
jgi:small subunit ribosomal protein S17